MPGEGEVAARVLDPVLGANVSRETLERLEVYHSLLLKWQKAYNLVGAATLADAWRRHFLDSLQILPHIDGVARTADLGSGAGFPGLALALVTDRIGRLSLVESNAKKCQFLREVIRRTGANAEVVENRIESLAPLGADLIFSRALAPLEKLLEYLYLHGTPEATGLFHKGSGAEEELTRSRQSWTFEVTRIQSLTDPRSEILRLSRVKPA